LIQFYDGHHWQMSEETLDRYADSAGPELWELMRFWTLMYLAYLFRWCIFGVYGAEVKKVMMSSLYGRMKRVPVTLENSISRAPLNIGLAITKKRTVGKHKDVEFPATYYAALCFIKFDPGSPWCMSADAPGDVTEKVIFRLAKIHDEIASAHPEF